MTTRFKGDIITDGNVSVGATMTVENGFIVEITHASSTKPINDFTGFLIAPGFIDGHVHGGGGADFMDATVDSVRQVLRTHARHGTTGLLATTITATHEQVNRCIEAVREVYASPIAGEARVLGIHLEGPYICAKRKGAQPGDPIRKPNIDELRHWQVLSGGLVKQITIAPEVDGALEFIREATAMGIVCSIGHTDGDAKQTAAGITAGARHATHLFNAMRGLHHREPGTAGALLASDDVTVEIICDGVHLAPEIVKLIVAAKGVERCVLITDAMSGADMPNGEYELGGNAVIVKDGVAAFPNGTLAGSVLTMESAFANVQRFANISYITASRMASGTPATQFGLTEVGSLEVGKRGDFVVIDPKSGVVEQTLIGGSVCYKR